eukprot:CAMPEP_0194763874 /NCGR_PEP_ID=MMETSP0323_2-20130528/20682_1 /TAXON_ID=2866 ORGANISM="Crypthecodinium cohnii, Strain Seligo" /NCGR_SAMPLE_ID=MMETSP0323_2 /ASSEMBLY_ACC=CAM_ASM_000346 /LENGTH=44 /DNA_ID= /DNA_START= /DNA_END= /DNA_ORIENTATION=
MEATINDRGEGNTSTKKQVGNANAVMLKVSTNALEASSLDGFSH